MSFYSTANVLIESLASDEVPGKELVQTYVMSLFDFEKEAAIIYDFLEDNGFLDIGVYMTKTDKVNNDAYGDSHYYIMFPRSVVVGTNVLKRFFKLYNELAQDNQFHFLIKQGDSMLIDGKSLVSDTYKVRKWRPMKKKTREHFGDILDGLRESKEEKWIYLLKVGRKKDGTAFARYKFLPYSSLSEEDFKIAEQLYDYTDTYAHGRYDGRNDINIKVYINKLGHKIDGYGTVLFYVGSKDLLEKELYDDKKYQYGTRMKEEIDLKPKTKKHFGEILSGLNEEITTGGIVASPRAHERIKSGGNPDHVVIFLTYDKRSGKQNEYIFKPIKTLNRQEIDIYKTLLKHKIDSSFEEEFNVSVFSTSDEVDFIPKLDYIAMFKGDKSELEKFLETYLRVNKREDYVEKKPIMGKKAEKHFGDIVDSL